MEKYVLDAAGRLPSSRQMAWQETEFYAFIHFGMNTFTNRAWGLGDESPALFNPSALDAAQWVRACKAAGMRGLILTCKHHDGFCLWPSKWTAHSVQNSPWQNGQGDVVQEVSRACRDTGLRFGIYLSPWDRHDPRYGDSPAYNAYFIGQLQELLTDYGPIFSVWLDGACGEGPNGQRQAYDWDAYYRVIRALQPNAVISVCGPDVRWCGNEAGHCRKSEWSVVPQALLDVEKIAEKSQQQDGRAFAKRITSADEDLGSRAAIRDAQKLIWYPAEVNTSIRPEWFYHPEEDKAVKSVAELLETYYASVGGNAAFLLNIPPDKRGLLHENDVARLNELGRALNRAFAIEASLGALAFASGQAEGFPAQNVLSGDKNTCWRPPEGMEAAQVTLCFASECPIDKVVLMEHIAAFGQRIEKFTLEYEDAAGWKPLYAGTVVGYKKICRFQKVTARAIRLSIEQSRWYPTLGCFKAFCEGDFEAAGEALPYAGKVL